MSDIVKVTEEEFDAEGNLIRRVITEYGVTPTPYKPPALPTDYKIRVGDTWPYAGVASGIYTVTDPNKYQSYNGSYSIQDLANNGED